MAFLARALRATGRGARVRASRISQSSVTATSAMDGNYCTYAIAAGSYAAFPRLTLPAPRSSLYRLPMYFLARAEDARRQSSIASDVFREDGLGNKCCIRRHYTSSYRYIMLSRTKLRYISCDVFTLAIFSHVSSVIIPLSMFISSAITD